MNQLYEPLTPLSRQLLHSVPRKVYLWLKSLQVDLTDASFQGDERDALGWMFDEEEKFGIVTLRQNGVLTLSVIWPDMDLVNSAGVKSGLPLPGPVEDHLSWFVQKEQAVYAHLEKIDEAIRAARNAKRD
jgi:hypothetical protein